MSGVAHFFVVVGGSKIHERLAHFFIDIYTLECEEPDDLDSEAYEEWEEQCEQLDERIEEIEDLLEG